MAFSTDDFTKEDLALIPEPEPHELAEMAAAAAAEQDHADSDQAADIEAQARNNPPDNNAPAPAPSGAPAPAPQADQAAAPKPQGDVRAALRAARRAEQRAVDELERERAARAEAERLLAERGYKPPQPAGSADELSDDEIDRLQSDYDPVVAKVARMAKRFSSAAPAPAAAPVQPEFIPPRLPAELQDVVDSLPDLLAWQYDPNQERFEAAKRADVYLSGLPAWQNATPAERLQEVVKRVNADLGRAAPSPTPNRADPRAVIDQLPSAEPNTLSDVPGAGGRQPAAGSNLSRYQAMTEEQILADLQRG